MKKKNKKIIPALSAGPDTVLSMNRGRVFVDRKKQARKLACRNKNIHRVSYYLKGGAYDSR